MQFERWIIDLLVRWGIDDAWLYHIGLFLFVIGLGLLPKLLGGLGLVLAAVLRVIFAALRAILPAALVGLGHVLAVVLMIAVRMALLLWFIALEAGRSNAQDEGDDRVGPEAARQSSGIAEACALLGLPANGFTPDDLKRAYRTAIKRAHPDQGGSAADTRAILSARDRIRDHFGWN